jgi:carbon storage regulator
VTPRGGSQGGASTGVAAGAGPAPEESSCCRADAPTAHARAGCCATLTPPAAAWDGRCRRPRARQRRQGDQPMLVLTRKSNQSIMIGDDIEVSVLSIMGEKVRIGIQAPREIPVFRKEVYLEIQQENIAAGTSARAEVDEALKRLTER